MLFKKFMQLPNLYNNTMNKQLLKNFSQIWNEF